MERRAEMHEFSTVAMRSRRAVTIQGEGWRRGGDEQEKKSKPQLFNIRGLRFVIEYPVDITLCR